MKNKLKALKKSRNSSNASSVDIANVIILVEKAQNLEAMRVTLSSLGVDCDTSQNLQQVMSLISIRNEVFNNEAMYKLILLDLEQKSKD